MSALPPGPKGSFLLGSSRAFRRDLMGFMRDAAAYGDLVHYRAGPVHIYQLNHPRLIKAVLQDHNDKVRKPWDFRQLKIALGEGLLTNEGAAWRAQRKHIQPAFHQERIRRYGEVMSRLTEQTIDHWIDGERRDLHADMMALTLRIVAQTLFGVELGRDMRAIETALERFMRQFERLITATVPLPLAWPTPGNLRAWRASRLVQRTVSQMMAERRRQGGGDDLLSWLLEGQAETGMSDRQVRDEVITLLNAGHETTANTLSWALALLAAQPAAAEALREELDRELAGRMPDAEDVPRLSYTRQIIQETMRLHPPAWTLTREVAEPFELDGYRLPRKAYLVLPQHVIHRDPRFYDQPDAFRPERWTEEFERTLPKYAYFPFGGGPRFCIGAGFAQLEAALILAALAQRVTWRLDPAHPLEPQSSVTLRPRHGIMAWITRRPPLAGPLERAL